jgi:hypothetical protein
LFVSDNVLFTKRIDSYYLLPKLGNIILKIRLVASYPPFWLKWKWFKKIHWLPVLKEGDMSYLAIIEYLASFSKLYFVAKKKEKTSLLDHAEKVTGRHRKSLIRIMSNAVDNLIKNNKKHSCGAKTKYPDYLTVHIKYLWESMERITPRRMKVAYKDWLPLYIENGVTSNVKLLLNKMSVSTLARFIKKIKVGYSLDQHGLCSTSPARYMKNKVPINTLDSTVDRPGFMQADTVAHCGTSLDGAFINSVTVTDIFSTWTENRALYTKKAPEIRTALTSIKIRLPFDLKAINTDSGSEFLNMPVYNYFTDQKIVFTRSRPYKKNDNCYVEQKNFTHTRELFGYQRFEEIAIRDLMNEIYIEYWNPLQNFFLPTFKLLEKIRIGAKIKKKYDAPRTPYHRLIDSSYLTIEQKEKLTTRKKELNPFVLKKGLEKKLRDFFNLVNEYNKAGRQNT